MKKKHELIILATDKKVDIGAFNWYLPKQKMLILNGLVSNLYILSDDEIKEGDWCYHTGRKLIFKDDSKAIIQRERHYYKKIIATTDSSLKIFIKSDNAAYTTKGQGYFKSLPQIPLNFIKHFISEYNKGNVIKKVEVEYQGKCYNCYEYHEDSVLCMDIQSREYNNQIEPFILKINKDNTINISVVEDKVYTKEKLIKIIKQVYLDGFNRSCEGYNGEYGALNNMPELSEEDLEEYLK